MEYETRSWDRIRAELTQRTLTLPLLINMTVHDAHHAEPNVYLLRHLAEEDVPPAVKMIVQEYGSHSRHHHDSNPVFDYLENWSLGFIVSVGLHQRIQRRKQGQGVDTKNQDHNVLCLFEYHSSSMIGMVEVSLQPLDPHKTAPAYVLPTEVKTLLSQITKTPHVPYVSNLLIEPTHRGKGYSKILMAACENLVLSWGYSGIYLHVDADTSGWKAQALYQGLGYQPVVDTTELVSSSNNQFSWMGSDMIQTQGLYFVDGLPLIFLHKDLKQ
jgi:GNAT superfamily N-acetyltransferase